MCIVATTVVVFIVINLLPSNIVQQGFNDLSVPTPSQLYIKTLYSKSSVVRLLDEQCPKPSPRFTKAERIEYYLGPQRPTPGSSSLPIIRTYSEALDLARVDDPHCIDSREVKNSFRDVNVGERRNAHPIPYSSSTAISIVHTNIQTSHTHAPKSK